MSRPLIEIFQLEKAYPKKNHVVPVLKGIDLCLVAGQFLSIMGSSGSGKSTLLNIIGCLDRPTSGVYYFDGVDVLKSSDDQLSRLRSRSLGFVFQNFNLISNLTVLENIELPFLYRDDNSTEIHRRVHLAIDQVGLSHRKDHKPAELSGGEMQRVAIARALVVAPKLIIADEPTGNLDSGTSLELMKIFRKLHQQGSTIILVTHDQKVAEFAEDCFALHDGRLVLNK
jgi:putative ABC transport system ATP-binding protein